jgi:hypothetical protein
MKVFKDGFLSFFKVYPGTCILGAIGLAFVLILGHASGWK